MTNDRTSNNFNNIVSYIFKIRNTIMEVERITMKDNNMYNDNSIMYKRTDIIDYEVYDFGYKSNFTISKDTLLINPIYIIVDNNIEFVYSLKSNKFYIIDNSGITDQEYLLSEEDIEFLKVLNDNLIKLYTGIHEESWLNELPFNKRILNILKYTEYEDNHVMLNATIDNNDIVYITFANYEEINLVYEGLRILMIVAINKLNTLKGE